MAGGRSVSARAGIVVTGTEVLTGRVTDRNGPWLADELRDLGVDLAHIVIVGDRPEDVREALGWLAGAGVDLIVTSGGPRATQGDPTPPGGAPVPRRAMALGEAPPGGISAGVRGLRARRARPA